MTTKVRLLAPRLAQAMMFVATAMVMGLLTQLGLLAPLDGQLEDWRFALQDRPPSGRFVLIDIDAKSLQAVGVWPWPRSIHARLLQALEAAGVDQVAFDVDFSSAGSQEGDQAFADALSSASVPVYLAAFAERSQHGSEEITVNQPIPSLRDGGWPALVNVPVETGTEVRSFPSGLLVGGKSFDAMPTLLAGVDSPPDFINIDYAIDETAIPHYSAADVLDGSVPAGALKGKSAIIGASAMELHDFFETPRFGRMQGSALVAMAAETLRQHRSLLWQPSWPITLGAGLVGVVLLVGLGNWWAIVPLGLAAILLEGTALIVQVRFGLVMPTAGAQVVLLTGMIWAFLREFDLRRILLKLARTEARNNARLLERVFSNGFDGILIRDEQGRIIRTNDAARALLGDEAGQLDRIPEELSAALADLPPPLPARSEVELIGQDGVRRNIGFTLTRFAMSDSRNAESEHTYTCLTLRDNTEQRQAAARMEYLAMHDAVTGLLNRRGLEGELTDRCRVGPCVLAYFDLDRFKNINDTLGHSVGDQLLVAVARRASDQLPEGASLARTGGDEFAVLLAGDIESCEAWANAFVARMAAPFLVSGHRIVISASMGLAATTGATAGGQDDASALMRNADLALQEAKTGGGNRVALFQPGLEATYRERLALEQDLALALDRDEFQLVFQPQVKLADGEVTGAEALLRWHHPQRGFVPPSTFIPVAEDAGMIHNITVWVLQQACMLAADWPLPVTVAVNLSAVDLRANDIVDVVDSALAGSGLPASRLELEITESAFMTGGAGTAAVFEALRARGIRFAIDDFGTGYSSLSYLHRYPFSMLKIDKSFVDSGPADAEAMTILASVIGMARALGLKSLAEGIEDQYQLEALRLLGCERGQGYLFSKPLPNEQFRNWLLGTATGAQAEAPSRLATGRGGTVPVDVSRDRSRQAHQGRSSG